MLDFRQFSLKDISFVELRDFLVDSISVEVVKNNGFLEANQYIDFQTTTVINSVKSKSISFAVYRGNEIVGLIVSKYLDWDSKHLNLPSFRIELMIVKGDYFHQLKIKEVLLNVLIKELITKKAKYIISRPRSSDFSSIHCLEDQDFKLIDCILTYSYNLEKFNYNSNKMQYDFEFASSKDFCQVESIGSKIFTKDRFHNDPFIKKRIAVSLHRDWLKNSLRGIAADTVIVAKSSSKVLGFITCKLHKYTNNGLTIGEIVLVGTNRDYRGIGVGYHIILEALKWFNDNKTKIVSVGTQINNFQANRLYQKCGFKLSDSSITFRKLIEKG